MRSTCICIAASLQLAASGANLTTRLGDRCGLMQLGAEMFVYGVRAARASLADVPLVRHVEVELRGSSSLVSQNKPKPL